MGEFAGRRVTVMGLGRFGGGVGLTRWLVRQGARVTVSDQADAESLGESIARLAGLDVAVHVGGHDERDFRQADLVVVNPAVPKDSPFLQVAREAGVALTTEMNLFFQRCAATIIGVTGTVGKSTTTAMIGLALSGADMGDGQAAAGGRRRTWVGGNIGRSLLEELERIEPGDRVVLELSSFQLEGLAELRCSPHIAVITSLAPNHLDRHGTFEAYRRAKLNIARFQDADRDHLVISEDDVRLREAVRELRGGLEGVWRYRAGPDGVVELIRDDQVVRWAGPELAVRGRHNCQNAAAAVTVARLCGLEPSRAIERLGSFAGLPHRLEFVRSYRGVDYYNDSKATAPEATMVALEAFDQGLVVLVGGYDKGVGFEQLGRALAGRAKAVVGYGATGGKIVAAVRANEQCGRPVVRLAERFDQAVELGRELAGPGEVVLLSPGCASFDMFSDYQQRGESFKQLVNSWA